MKGSYYNLDDLTKTANDLFGTNEIKIEEQDFLPQNLNKNLGQCQFGDLKSNKEIYEPYAIHCNRYDPCPICYKCRNKASHLYIKCDKCPIPICVHTNAQKEMMIKRNNFKITVSKEVIASLK